MGIYSHYTTEQLQTLRDSLTQSLHDRLTKPTAAGSADRNAQFNQRTDEIRKEIHAVCAEMDARSGAYAHRPIYLV
jgi:flagellar biosynthesis/type III secretory pathway chaperone